MQGANLLKRRLGEGAEPESYVQKRVCLESEVQIAEYPMDTSNGLTSANRQEEKQVGAIHANSSKLCCPRCLGGEPGHISHIMGH